MEPTKPRSEQFTLIIAKRGSLRFLGHRDYARTLMRALRRAGVPVELTKGFRPHVRMILPEPLPVGVGSEGEEFVIYLTAPVEVAELGDRVAAQLPSGMELVDTLAGRHRPKVDEPLRLRIRSGSPELVADWARGSSLDELNLARLDVEPIEAESAELFVVLVPHQNLRASIGRFQRGLRAALEDSEVDAEIDRVRAEDCNRAQAP